LNCLHHVLFSPKPPKGMFSMQARNETLTHVLGLQRSRSFTWSVAQRKCGCVHLTCLHHVLLRPKPSKGKSSMQARNGTLTHVLGLRRSRSSTWSVAHRKCGCVLLYCLHHVLLSPKPSKGMLSKQARNGTLTHVLGLRRSRSFTWSAAHRKCGCVQLNCLHHVLYSPKPSKGMFSMQARNEILTHVLGLRRSRSFTWSVAHRKCGCVLLNCLHCPHEPARLRRVWAKRARQE